MKEDKDYNKRLEGHAEPLEIEEHYEASAAAGGVVPEGGTPASSTPARGHAGGGGIGWAAIGGLAAAFAVCAVYVCSGWGRKADQPMQLSETMVTQTVLTAPTTQPMQEYQTNQTAQTGQTAQAVPADHPADAVYLFTLDSAGISEDQALNEVARKAKESGADVEIFAYTDPSGSDVYNQKLSQRRADAIAKYLEAHGVDASHIHAQGCGPTHEFATAAQDRRAEVHLM